MSKPTPKHIEPAEIAALAAKTIQSARFPFLASIDGNHPRVRPVSPVRVDGFTIYVANLKVYHKTQEIAANSNVELCYMDSEHNQVRIEGAAEILADRKLLQEIWDANPLMRQFLGSIDNPQLIIYKIVPKRVRYMQEWALEYYEVPV